MLRRSGYEVDEGSGSGQSLRVSGRFSAAAARASLVNPYNRDSDDSAMGMEEVVLAPDMAMISTLLAEMLEALKLLFTGAAQREHGESVAISSEAQRVVEEYRKLRRLVRIELLAEESTARKLRQKLAQPATGTVLAALLSAVTAPNPGGEPRSKEARRQLMFFCNSLHNRALHKPPPVARMRSLSSFTPHYAEEVTTSLAQLHGELDDNVDLLHLLQSLFPDEWENFTERLGVPGLSDSDKIDADALCRWASDRGQVLSRTVRGVMLYGDALRVLARLEGVAEEEVEAVVGAKFEYVVACQQYGKMKRSKKADDRWKALCVDDLRHEFAANLRVAYVEDEDGVFYSILLGVDPLTDEERTLFKVRLPGNPIIGEGKPENQNHAIIFTRGEHLQTLDMNQDNYMGESFKMRNLLERFTAGVRIVGFREHIFSESGGAVAHFAASNELVFGTMVQRFLAWPLRVRFHYGHPDVWDKVWAFSSGGVSKASRTLHVSEDIFGGINVVLRGGAVEYYEFIHCGKGRDMGFIAVNGFEQKISTGNAMQLLSRDLYRLSKRVDLFRLLSMYFTGTGFYLATMQTIWAIYIFMLANVLLMLTGTESYDEYVWNNQPDALRIAAEATLHRRLAGASPPAAAAAAATRAPTRSPTTSCS